MITKVEAAVKKLNQMYAQASQELTELRKKERIFNLHKRCAEDSTKKLSEHSKKLAHLQQISSERAVVIKELEDKLGDNEIQLKNANF